MPSVEIVSSLTGLLAEQDQPLAVRQPNGRMFQGSLQEVLAITRLSMQYEGRDARMIYLEAQDALLYVLAPPKRAVSKVLIYCLEE